MTLGVANKQGDLLDDVTRFCDETLDKQSIYAFLHRERDQLFPDEAFADLFDDKGRRSVPPSVVAVVMVLQRLEGLSDREAAERYCFDNRWRYAAGVGGYDSAGWTGFAHTVLVDMRERLRRSEQPNRIFDAARDAAKVAGLIGRKRVLDSTPLYDAVATMDTVTLIRSAIRGLLKVAEAELAAALRAVLGSGDDYATSAKPMIDWDDEAARAALIDSRAKDAYACLLVLEGKASGPEVTQAASLLATVAGQDIEVGDDGTFRIARKVAQDRVISTVDPEARHGRKTQAKGFDGYKGHAAIDPDSEIITETVVTPGNAGDASVADELIADLLADDRDPSSGTTSDGEESADHLVGDEVATNERATVYGDNAYGTGTFQERLEEVGIESRCKTQNPTAAGGIFTKDHFDVDVAEGTVTCPNGVTVVISPHRKGGGMAYFRDACSTCALRPQCTTASGGRTISISAHEEALARARARQVDPSWRDDYRATRPKVERKLAHLMRRRHGGRRARVRGRLRVDADFALLAAATNLARLATLEVRSIAGKGWAVAG
jgi:IS5 family transposase